MLIDLVTLGSKDNRKQIDKKVTGPEKTSLIYTKYTFQIIIVPISYSVAMCYAKSVPFIEFLLKC